MSGTLRSGQLAKAAGVNVQTLRYYERRGLLADPQRSPGGHREYGQEALTVLQAVRGLAKLGFTLDEITDLIKVGSHRGPRPGLAAAATSKLAEVDAKIAHLQHVRSTLVDVIAADCGDLDECRCTPSCPIPFADLSPTPSAAGARTGSSTSPPVRT